MSNTFCAGEKKGSRFDSRYGARLIDCAQLVESNSGGMRVMEDFETVHSALSTVKFETSECERDRLIESFAYFKRNVVAFAVDFEGGLGWRTFLFRSRTRV